jgi:hypothetical protein
MFRFLHLGVYRQIGIQDCGNRPIPGFVLHVLSSYIDGLDAARPFHPLHRGDHGLCVRKQTGV